MYLVSNRQDTSQNVLLREIKISYRLDNSYWVVIKTHYNYWCCLHSNKTITTAGRGSFIIIPTRCIFGNQFKWREDVKGVSKHC